MTLRVVSNPLLLEMIDNLQNLPISRPLLEDPIDPAEYVHEDPFAKPRNAEAGHKRQQQQQRENQDLRRFETRPTPKTHSRVTMTAHTPTGKLRWSRFNNDLKKDRKIFTYVKSDVSPPQFEWPKERPEDEEYVESLHKDPYSLNRDCSDQDQNR